MLAKKRFKRKESQSLLSKIFISVLILSLLIFFIISSIRLNKKRSEFTKRIESLEKEIQILEEKNEMLKAGILHSGEEEYWEAKIREQGYKKPGEETIVVLPPEEQNEKKEENKSLNSIWQWMKSKF